MVPRQVEICGRVWPINFCVWEATLNRGKLVGIEGKSLPLHWPVWPRGTEGFGDRAGALPSEARVLPGPARVASCGEPTPAPTHPAVDCSGYVGVLGTEISQQVLSLFTAASPSQSVPPHCSRSRGPELHVPSPGACKAASSPGSRVEGRAPNLG